MGDSRKYTYQQDMQERSRILVDKEYQKELGRRIKVYRLSHAVPLLSWVGALIAVIGLVLAILLNLPILILLFGIVGIGMFIWFKVQMKPMSDSVIWDYVNQYYDSHGFRFRTGSVYELPKQDYKHYKVPTLNQVEDILNKKLESVSTEGSGVYFGTDNTSGIIFGVKATCVEGDDQKDGDVVDAVGGALINGLAGALGASSKPKEKKIITAFDGIVIRLERVEDYDESRVLDNQNILQLFEGDTKVSIVPATMGGKLWSSVLGMVSKNFKDIPFQNTKLNDKLSMRVENDFFVRSKKSEQFLNKFTISFEEVLYQLFELYGPFYMQIEGGQLWLALDTRGKLFSKNKKFKDSYKVYRGQSEETFAPERWTHLFNLVSILEALTFYLVEMNENENKSFDITQQHSVFDTLVKSKINTETKDFREGNYQWLKELRELTKFSISEVKPENRYQLEKEIFMEEE